MRLRLTDTTLHRIDIDITIPISLSLFSVTVTVCRFSFWSAQRHNDTTSQRGVSSGHAASGHAASGHAASGHAATWSEHRPSHSSCAGEGHSTSNASATNADSHYSCSAEPICKPCLTDHCTGPQSQDQTALSCTKYDPSEYGARRGGAQGPCSTHQSLWRACSFGNASAILAFSQQTSSNTIIYVG